MAIRNLKRNGFPRLQLQARTDAENKNPPLQSKDEQKPWYHLDSQILYCHSEEPQATWESPAYRGEIATPVCALARNDSEKLPQNAITGAPGYAYLSTYRLPDHVHRPSLYLFPPTEALCIDISGYSSVPSRYISLVLYPEFPTFVKGERKSLPCVRGGGSPQGESEGL